MYTMRFVGLRAWCAGALALVFGFFAVSAWADPPNRVARVSFLGGNVSFQPAGDDQWAGATLNRPLVTGDKVHTDQQDSRVELQIGAADIRLDSASTLDLLNLDDTIAQMELLDGVMNLRVRYVGPGQTYEVDTPTLAFVVTQPGNYRVDIDPQGHGTMITVFDGSGNVYGEKSASYNVVAGKSYRFNDSMLHDYEVLDIPQPDDFDQWCRSRDAQYTNSPSSKYVPQDMIGYTDLDANGSWATTPDYGNVWYPNTVAADWAPYRDGSWSWVDPWGWTWVDNAPWGFAPSHYGRWAYIDNRWGWCPGPVAVGGYGAMYSPAMVAFAGGLGVGIGIDAGPVGWFPLGPRDVYMPWYGASRGYFNNMNRRNAFFGANDRYLARGYGNFAAGRPFTGFNYAYRNNAGAFTAVPRDVFAGARPVAGARMGVDANMLRNANVVGRVGVAPTRASFAGGMASRGGVPQAGVLNRNVVAHTAPPAATRSIASRMDTLQRNGGQPLSSKELRGAQSGAGAASAQRVQVVGRNARPQALPTPTRGAAAANPAGNAAAGARGSVGNAAAGARSSAAARNALPSAGFAPHAGGANGAAAGARSGERGAQPQNRASINGAARSQAAPAERAAQQARTQQQRSGMQPQNRTPANVRSPATQTAPAERAAARMQNAQPRAAQQARSGMQPQNRASAEGMARSQPAQAERAAPRMQNAQPRAAQQAPRVQQHQNVSRPQPQQHSQPQVHEQHGGGGGKGKGH